MATNLLFQEWETLATRRSSFLVLLRFGNNIFLQPSQFNKILKKNLVASPHSSFDTTKVIQEGPCSNSIHSWCCALEVWLTPTVHTVKWSKEDVQYNNVYFYLLDFYIQSNPCVQPLPGKVSWESIGLLIGRSWAQSPAVPTLTVLI